MTNISLAASKWRRIFVLFYAMIVLGLVTIYCSGSLKWVLLVFTVLATAYAWHEPNNSIQKIMISKDKKAVLFWHNLAQEADLCGQSFVSRFVCLLRWRTNSQAYWQCVFFDNTDADSYRRLCVWARFHRE